jgi:hypothetical protein
MKFKLHWDLSRHPYRTDMVESGGVHGLLKVRGGEAMKTYGMQAD